VTQHNATPKKPRWRPAFLAVLRNSASVRAACDAAGINRTTAYRARERSPEFRAAWDQALDESCDLLVAEAQRRALEVSDTLLIFLLKSHRPAVYREPPARVDITGYVRLIAEREGLDYDEVLAEAERITRGG
jgi:hypothetical protein